MKNVIYKRYKIFWNENVNTPQKVEMNIGNEQKVSEIEFLTHLQNYPIYWVFYINVYHYYHFNQLHHFFIIIYCLHIKTLYIYM